MVGLLAVSCGLTVATNYYAQVLIPAIARDLRMPGATVGLLVPLAQIGFIVGIVFIVPLGDLLQRSRLVSALLVETALALGLAAVAGNFMVLATATFAAGVCSVAAQVLVALAATLAAPNRQGRVVGQVMSGLLIGVLLARTMAGIVAAGLGWRWVYASAAIVLAVLAGVLIVALPDIAPSSELRYRQLLLSVAHLLVVHPQLRLRIVYGAVTFAGFGTLWTTVALLAADRYHYTEATIGLLALVGAAGALAAQGSGRLVDAGLLHVATGVFLLTILGGWVAGAYGSSSIAALILSLILIDLGVQGIHIANQSAIYRLDPTARNRITTAYITLYFGGGAIGSATAAIAYGRAGWPAVVVSGIVFTAIGIAVWAVESALGAQQCKIFR
jgi:predicted MFS family arabinose efflux permease